LSLDIVILSFPSWSIGTSGIKRKANKRVIEGECGRQEKMIFREKAKNGTNSKRNRYKVTISRIKQIGYIL